MEGFRVFLQTRDVTKQEELSSKNSKPATSIYQFYLNIDFEVMLNERTDRKNSTLLWEKDFRMQSLFVCLSAMEGTQ